MANVLKWKTRTGQPKKPKNNNEIRTNGEGRKRGVGKKRGEGKRKQGEKEEKKEGGEKKKRLCPQAHKKQVVTASIVRLAKQCELGVVDATSERRVAGTSAKKSV